MRYTTPYDYFKSAAKKGRLFEKLIYAIDRSGKHKYFKVHYNSKISEILDYIKITSRYGLSLDDFKFVMNKYQLGYKHESLIYGLIQEKRVELADFVFNQEREFYLKQTDVIYLIQYKAKDIKIREYLLNLFQVDLSKADPVKVWLLYNQSVDGYQDTAMIDLLLKYGANINIVYHSKNFSDSFFTFSFSPYYSEKNVHQDDDRAKLPQLVKKGLDLNNPELPALFHATKMCVKSVITNDILYTVFDLLYDYNFHKIKNAVLFKHIQFEKSIAFVVQYGANAKIEDERIIMMKYRDKDLSEYIAEFLHLDIDKSLAKGKIPMKTPQEVENATIRFHQWQDKMRSLIENKIMTGIKQGYTIREKTQQILGEILWKMGAIKPELRLSYNLINYIMEFHGGVGEAMGEHNLLGFNLLLKKIHNSVDNSVSLKSKNANRIENNTKSLKNKNYNDSEFEQIKKIIVKEDNRELNIKQNERQGCILEKQKAIKEVPDELQKQKLEIQYKIHKSYYKG
ncbi:hypothetical protein PPERSA_05206 [Pseudocohnilembus persalinus]|uniref:Uncharacterized protein n=1 Tax=Pseudocohnilembus persalinus TaxID=266149 RepID=A0A0V0R9E0_PSEPJ|nr:hypothetical protein PPERSA_05206 [Pseudocohnilembus persalinus]|eukprot:KRX11097.1 hypothetical protein PPERSA_05206 [Pseudocohnilembus persalinus]